MNWNRIKAVGKLALLFCAPSVVVVGLFGSGVYVGHAYRHPITTFENEWLNLDVEVPKPDPEPAEPEPESGPVRKSDRPAPVPVPQSEAPVPARLPGPEEGGHPAGAPAAVEEPAAGRAPGTGLGPPVVVGVKVLVDDTVLDRRPDWIDYVQRTLSEAAAIYDQQFGIDLELVAVGRWGVAGAGLSAAELLRDVEARPRDSASVIIGLTARPLDGRVAGHARVPAADDPFNGSAAVVYAQPATQPDHLRPLLRELGRMFGAQDIADPAHPDFRSGSWMSDAPVPPGRIPWIDAANRARILGRKGKPFASAGRTLAGSRRVPEEKGNEP